MISGIAGMTIQINPDTEKNVSLMQETPSPFINAIYDREPLQHFVQGRIALVGEAAHPTTPHALRSTNMAITDAGAGLPLYVRAVIVSYIIGCWSVLQASQQPGTPWLYL